MPQRDARPGILREAERAVTVAHAEAVAAFTAQNRISSGYVDIVGFHGQTVLHRPEQKMTVQIGDAAALAFGIGPIARWTERPHPLAVGFNQGDVDPVERGAAHQTDRRHHHRNGAFASPALDTQLVSNKHIL